MLLCMKEEMAKRAQKYQANHYYVLKVLFEQTEHKINNLIKKRGTLQLAQKNNNITIIT